MRALPPVHSNTRRVTVTHDGRPVGFTEKLEGDNPARKAHAAHVKRLCSLEKSNAESQARGAATMKRRRSGFTLSPLKGGAIPAAKRGARHARQERGA